MKDITGKTQKDLEVMLLEKSEALRTFRFGLSGTQTRNVREGRNLKKAVAQIKTGLNRLKAQA